MNDYTRGTSIATAILALCAITGCGGGSAPPVPPPPPPAVYSVGGVCRGNDGLRTHTQLQRRFTARDLAKWSLHGRDGCRDWHDVQHCDRQSAGESCATCTVSHGSGTLGTANVTAVTVYCPQAVGTRAYVVTAGSAENITNPPDVILGSISVYAIDSSTGALTLVPASTVSTGPYVGSFQLVPHSSFAWALNVGDSQALPGYNVSSIYAYAVDPTTGLLTAATGNPFP